MKVHATILSTLVACAGCGPGYPRDASTSGWTVQLDDKGLAPAAGRFVLHEDGDLEVTPGPNANAWSPGSGAGGDVHLAADVTHLDSGLHPHGAGIVFGGRDVGSAAERYGYFLVRGDRNFLVKVREGDRTRDVVTWTEHPAVAAEDANGVTRNRLSVEADGEHVRFLVNGAEVHKAPRKDVPVEGTYGYRLVHDLHVRFGAFERRQRDVR